MVPEPCKGVSFLVWEGWSTLKRFGKSLGPGCKADRSRRSVAVSIYPRRTTCESAGENKKVSSLHARDETGEENRTTDPDGM